MGKVIVLKKQVNGAWNSIKSFSGLDGEAYVEVAWPSGLRRWF